MGRWRNRLEGGGFLWPRINNADATPEVTPASIRSGCPEGAVVTG